MILASPTGMVIRLSRTLRERGRFFTFLLTLFLLCTGGVCSILSPIPSGDTGMSRTVHAECPGGDASTLEALRGEADDFVPRGRSHSSSTLVRQLLQSNSIHSPGQKTYALLLLIGVFAALTAARRVSFGMSPAIPPHFPSILKKVQPVRAGPVL